MSSSNTVRFRAIAQLQAVLAKHNPGSWRYRQIEFALDLALSEKRGVDDYLVRNLLRDAKRILERQTSSRNFVDLDDDVQPTPDALIDFMTPEKILEASELVRAIVASVSRSSRHAERVLEGLFVGETANETAVCAGISAARVNQLRRELRGSAAAYLGSRNGH